MKAMNGMIILSEEEYNNIAGHPDAVNLMKIFDVEVSRVFISENIMKCCTVLEYEDGRFSVIAPGIEREIKRYEIAKFLK